MTSSLIKKARIKCPACQEFHDVDIPEKIFDKATETGIVTISFKTECGHFCQAFVDRNFKIRGEACADVSLDEMVAGMETPEMVQVSDLVVKLASEVIRINVQFNEIIKKIGVQKNVDFVEKALLSCQIQEVKNYLDQLYARVVDVGEMDFAVLDFAVQLQKEITWFNKLVESKIGFDWSSIEMRSMLGMGAQEYAHMKGVQYERLRQIFATLEFEAIDNELNRDAVKMEKIRLVDLMDNMD